MIRIVKQLYFFSSFTVKNIYSNTTLGQYQTPTIKQLLLDINQHKNKWNSINYHLKEQHVHNFISKLQQSANFSSITQLLSSSTGKQIKQCHSELHNSINIIKHQLSYLQKYHFHKQVISIGQRQNNKLQKGLSRFRYQPFDLAISIFAHRQPLLAALSYLPLSLLSGSPLILRPSPQALPAVQKLVKLWLQVSEVDVYRILFQKSEEVNGDDSRVSELLNASEGFVSYMGRLRQGLDLHYLISQSNEVFRRSEFMLTSSDSAYVMKDLGSEQLCKSVRMIARGCFSNSGHSFNSIKRVFVDEQLSEQFERLLRQQMKRYAIDQKLLNGQQVTYNQGLLAPFVLKKQFQQSISILKDIKQNHHSQIQLLEGGQSITINHNQNQLNFIQPTLFKVTSQFPNYNYQNIQCMMPICFLSTVSSTQNCIQKINSSIFGTTTSLFTNNIDTQFIQSIGQQIEVGTINVNSWEVSEGITYGGRKRSGKGFSLSGLSRQNLVRTKIVSGK